MKKIDVCGVGRKGCCSGGLCCVVIFRAETMTNIHSMTGFLQPTLHIEVNRR